MPPDASSLRPASSLGLGARPVDSGDLLVPTQRDAGDDSFSGGRLGARLHALATPDLVPTPELVEQLAEELYNGLDPRFVDWEWQDATEGARQWARGRAQRLIAAYQAGPTGPVQPADGQTR